jgi:hypothetical protein
MDISDILSELADDEERSSPKPPAAGWPYALAVQSQLLPGRTRRCAFWVSAFVPPAMRYVIDTTQLAGRWQHNPAEDAIPADALLVVVRPDDAAHIRKAMASWQTAPHPSFVAARIIDSMCHEDPTLAARLRWKMAS